MAEYNSPNWQAEGVEPPETMKKAGFIAGYKPPAAYFNWFFKRTSDCITELQNTTATTQETVSKSVTALQSAINTKADNNHSHSQYATTTTLTEALTKKAETGHKHEQDEITGLETVLQELKDADVGKKTSVEGAEIFNDYENNEANGEYSTATGWACIASGDCSYAGGEDSTATGNWSFAQGSTCHANGNYSVACGDGVIANTLQCALGRYNVNTTAPTTETDTTGSIFVVGIGTSDTNRANALRISTEGRCYGTSAFGSSGADYAEYFEWLDGNENGDDRRGLFVTLDGEKIRLANADDDFILGVVSATPSMVGDVQSEQWKDRYITDVFGSPVFETVETDGKKEKRYIENPKYDRTKEYISREERKEWDAVGMLGKLIVIDDGTCEVNGYCTTSNNGIATATTSPTAYRVLSRVDKNHIKILVK